MREMSRPDLQEKPAVGVREKVDRGDLVLQITRKRDYRGRISRRLHTCSKSGTESVERGRVMSTYCIDYAD